MSKPISIDLPHQLGRAEARRRIEAGFDRLGQQFGGGGFGQLHKEWQGERMAFSAHVLGQSITGRLEVLEEAIHLEVDLPALFALMAGKIRGRLKSEGQLLLEKK